MDTIQLSKVSQPTDYCFDRESTNSLIVTPHFKPKTHGKSLRFEWWTLGGHHQTWYRN